ncbi:MAG TPA: type II CAAX endopeptidase family protein [Luteolibacter sp.]
MPDFPARILQICYFVVLGLFVIVALFRRTGGPGRSHAEPTGVTEEPPVSTIDLPSVVEDARPVIKPPALPATPGISTDAYRRFDFLWMGTLFLLFYQLGMSQAASTEPMDYSRISIVMLVVSAAFQFFLAGITVALVAWRVRPVTWLGLRWRGWAHALWIGPSVVAALYVFQVVLHATGYMKWMESLGAETVQDTVKFFLYGQDKLALGAMAVAAVIVAPICEEIVFRGYLYPAAKRFAGPATAMFCSALLFSLAHGSLAMLLPLFLLGFAFAWIYERTGSLWAPIFAHFCLNGSTVLLQFLIRHFHLPVDL